jgi:cyclic-di-GMP phosphodiesterase, flagellum assembly factor TipF
MTTKSNGASGRLLLLDTVVLLAMAITATAFAAGLVLNSGIDMMAGAIAGAALFMVMASSHYVITRQSRAATVGGRLEELEEALIVLDGDLQRIDQVEDDVARLDLLTDRVERLDQAVTEFDGGSGAGRSGEQVERLSGDLERLHERLDALRSDFEAETRTQREQIGAELRSLEDLIKELSRELATSPVLAATTAHVPYKVAENRLPREQPDASAAPDRAVEMAALLDEVKMVSEEPEEDVAPAALLDESPGQLAEDEADEDEVVLLVAEEPAVILATESRELAAGDNAVDAETHQVLRDAIETSRIDLYVQPIVALPGRKPRYYDTLAHIRRDEDNVMLSGNFLRVAEHEGLMPRIDNVMLVKCVQVLRRLGPDSRLQGVFCNLSAHSLLDRDFFPELVEFMEENSALGDSLTFQIDQRAIRDLTVNELANLKTLGKLGFCFSLDQVTNLDIEFAALRDHFFRFVKLDAGILLHGTDEVRAGIAAEEMTSYLDRFDLKLIVRDVADEASLERLMDYGVELAEGDLFAEPRPLSPDMLRELEDADAA